MHDRRSCILVIGQQHTIDLVGFTSLRFFKNHLAGHQVQTMKWEKERAKDEEGSRYKNKGCRTQNAIVFVFQNSLPITISSLHNIQFTDWFLCLFKESFRPKSIIIKCKSFPSLKVVLLKWTYIMKKCYNVLSKNLNICIILSQRFAYAYILIINLNIHSLSLQKYYSFNRQWLPSTYHKLHRI